MARKQQPGRKSGPRVLFLDIETAPLLAFVWQLWDQNVALNQIRRDWFVMSWAARWADDLPGEVTCFSQKRAKNVEDDSAILKVLWRMLDEADIVVAHNGKAFDIKKLNARFITHGMQSPSPYSVVDTKIWAKKYFAFPSNKLEYLSNTLNKKYRKLKHEKFAGFELWSECLRGNKAAWEEMEKYNKYDVLALEELYNTLRSWADDHPNHSLYNDIADHICSCGSVEFQKRGFHYTTAGKYQTYRCCECGAYTRDKINLFDKDKRKSLRVNIPR